MPKTPKQETDLINHSDDGLIAEHVRATRGHDLNKVVVDIVESASNVDNRNSEAKNIEILTMVPSAVSPDRVEPAIQSACRRLFGPKRNPDYFTLRFLDTRKLADKLGDEKAVKMQAGDDQAVTQSFEITIHPPKSSAYTIDELEQRYLRALNQAL